mmetsp:Transcript_21095/g.54013  ORF Transcript_21095/g.54013 Transcript_21095/m.54013 type:complete len:214 (+) Transcript_21095:434-1075(+)
MFMNSQPEEKSSRDSRPQPDAIHSRVCLLHVLAQSQKLSRPPARTDAPASGGRSTRMSRDPVPASTVPFDQSSRAPGASASPSAKLSVRMSSACNSLYRCDAAGSSGLSAVPITSLAPSTAAAHSAPDAVTLRARQASTSALVVEGSSSRKTLRVLRAWCCHLASSASICSTGGIQRGSTFIPEAAICHAAYLIVERRARPGFQLGSHLRPPI